MCIISCRINKRVQIKLSRASYQRYLAKAIPLRCIQPSLLNGGQANKNIRVLAKIRSRNYYLICIPTNCLSSTKPCKGVKMRS